LLFISSAFGQKSDPKVSTPDPNKKVQVVETACGECQFKLAVTDVTLRCVLMARLILLLVQISILMEMRMQKMAFVMRLESGVQGNLVNDRFKVTYFKLLKEAEKKEQPTTQKN
jgi:hypothetical protein